MAHVSQSAARLLRRSPLVGRRSTLGSSGSRRASPPAPFSAVSRRSALLTGPFLLFVLQTAPSFPLRVTYLLVLRPFMCIFFLRYRLTTPRRPNLFRMSPLFLLLIAPCVRAFSPLRSAFLPSVVWLGVRPLGVMAL